MKPSPLGFAAAFLLTGCATTAPQPLDHRAAWTCASRTTGDGIAVSVVRTLDGRGRQLRAAVQWSVGGFDRGRLTLAGQRDITRAGEPPLRPRELHVSWSGFNKKLQRSRLLLVLHAADDWAHPLDGVAMIPYLNGLIGAAIPWQRLQALASVSHAAELSVIEENGTVIRSAPVDLTTLLSVRERLRANLDSTRRKAATFNKSCEPVTEWMAL